MCLRDGQLNVQRCGLIHEPVRLHEPDGLLPPRTPEVYRRVACASFHVPICDGLSAVTGEVSGSSVASSFHEHNDSLNSRGVN